LHPQRIIATDLFSFDESWEQVARHCHDRFSVPVEFRAAPLEDHSFLGSGSVDLCASDAVFEHCTNLRAVLGETHRLLRAGGSVYATYGPLWFAPGGDHFSGRGGLYNVYNHIALSADDYRHYFKNHRSETEGFQSGGRYVELGLFSKLTTGQYLAAFAEAGFDRDGLIIELATKAPPFRRQFPAAFTAILKKTWIYALKMIC
jgi:SAM-dependent methyltransferase